MAAAPGAPVGLQSFLEVKRKTMGSGRREDMKAICEVLPVEIFHK